MGSEPLHLEQLSRYDMDRSTCRPVQSSRIASTLPLIFRHFAIHLLPNGDISPDHPSHIHALPEWDRQNAYIIAWQFRSTATLEGAWTTQAGEEPETRQVLGKAAIELLITECNKRKEKWEEMCEDPKVALELEAELRVSVAPHTPTHPNGFG